MAGTIYGKMIKKSFWAQAACNLVGEPDKWIEKQDEIINVVDG